MAPYFRFHDLVLSFFLIHYCVWERPLDEITYYIGSYLLISYIIAIYHHFVHDHYLIYCEWLYSLAIVLQRNGTIFLLPWFILVFSFFCLVLPDECNYYLVSLITLKVLSSHIILLIFIIILYVILIRSILWHLILCQFYSSAMSLYHSHHVFSFSCLYVILICSILWHHIL